MEGISARVTREGVCVDVFVVVVAVVMGRGRCSLLDRLPASLAPFSRLLSNF